MLRLSVVVVLACLTGASLGMIPEKLIKKYGYTKIMSSCFGEEYVMRWTSQMKVAAEKCHQGQTSDVMPEFSGILAELRRNAMRRPIVMNVPYQQNSHFPQFNPMGQMAQYNPFASSYRSKRSLTPESIKTLKEKITTRISNITCVLQELKMLDADKKPNYDYLMQEISEMNIDDALKADVLEGCQICKDLASCLPVEKAKHPIKRELGTAMGFMKCMHMQKLEACMKADFRKYAPIMGWAEDLDDPLMAISGLEMLKGDDTSEALMENVDYFLSGGSM